MCERESERERERERERETRIWGETVRVYGDIESDIESGWRH